MGKIGGMGRTRQRRVRPGNHSDGEGGDEEHPFDQGGENNRGHQNRGGGTRIAAGGFGGLGADETDAEAGTEGGQRDCE